ncbi:unnamed protein product [Urochloa humidicola]
MEIFLSRMVGGAGALRYSALLRSPVLHGDGGLDTEGLPSTGSRRARLEGPRHRFRCQDLRCPVTSSRRVIAHTEPFAELCGFDSSPQKRIKRSMTPSHRASNRFTYHLEDMRGVDRVPKRSGGQYPVPKRQCSQTSVTLPFTRPFVLQAATSRKGCAVVVLILLHGGSEMIADGSNKVRSWYGVFVSNSYKLTQNRTHALCIICLGTPKPLRWARAYGSNEAKLRLINGPSQIIATIMFGNCFSFSLDDSCVGMLFDTPKTLDDGENRNMMSV